MQKQAQRRSEDEFLCPACGKTLDETVVSRCPHCGATGLQFEIKTQRFLYGENFDWQLGVMTPYLFWVVGWFIAEALVSGMGLPWQIVLANMFGVGMIGSLLLAFGSRTRFPTYSNGVRDSLRWAGKFGLIALLIILGLLQLCGVG